MIMLNFVYRFNFNIYIVTSLWLSKGFWLEVKSWKCTCVSTSVLGVSGRRQWLTFSWCICSSSTCHINPTVGRYIINPALLTKSTRIAIPKPIWCLGKYSADNAKSNWTVYPNPSSMKIDQLWSTSKSMVLSKKKPLFRTKTINLRPLQ